MAPRIVMAIRHAEKPDQGMLGVDERGENDKKSLTPRGWQRAGALAVLFGAPPADSRPTHVFAAGADADGPSKRPLQTVAPLAQKLGLDVEDRFDKEQVADAFAASVELTEDAVVLLAWEHKTLAKYLSAGELTPGVKIDGTVPRHWPDDRFDVVWIFERTSPTLYRFKSEPQLLLSGDQAAF